MLFSLHGTSCTWFLVHSREAGPPPYVSPSRHLTPGRLGLPPYVSPSMPNAWTDLPLAPALCPLSTMQVLSSRHHCYSGVKDIPPCHSVYWTKLKHKYRVLVYVRSMLPCGVLVLGDSVNKPELFCEQSDLCRHFLWKTLPENWNHRSYFGADYWLLIMLFLSNIVNISIKRTLILLLFYCTKRLKWGIHTSCTRTISLRFSSANLYPAICICPSGECKTIFS